MKLTFSAPSKTYLCGEYAVLAGGPALIVNTEPRFRLEAKTGAGLVRGLPEGSPSARWVSERAALLKNWDIEFIDPHEGRGGFGASGAQFLFVHALTTFIESSAGEAAQGLNLRKTWEDHQTLCAGGGSGADLWAQALGKITCVDLKSVKAEARDWPFDDLDFAIARTSEKVRTHDHVRDLDRQKLSHVVALSSECVENFRPGSSQEFLRSVKEFSSELRNINLQAESTLDRLRAVEKQSWCLAAKGCGALGADTILVLFKKANRVAARNFFSELGLPVVAQTDEISGGMEMQWSWNEN